MTPGKSRDFPRLTTSMTTHLSGPVLVVWRTLGRSGAPAVSLMELTTRVKLSVNLTGLMAPSELSYGRRLVACRTWELSEEFRQERSASTTPGKLWACHTSR